MPEAFHLPAAGHLALLLAQPRLAVSVPTWLLTAQQDARGRRVPRALRLEQLYMTNSTALLATACPGAGASSPEGCPG